MIETFDDCLNFNNENKIGDIFIHIIPVNDDLHPLKTIPSIIFIKNIKTKKTFGFAPHHPDSTPLVSLNDFVKICLIDFKNKIWGIDKKTIEQFIHIKNVYDLNFLRHQSGIDQIDYGAFNTNYHNFIISKNRQYNEINIVIPYFKHKELFELITVDIINNIEECELDSGYIKYNDIIISTLGKIETQGICINQELFTKTFKYSNDNTGIVYSQYNVCTSTGRPSNRFGGINFSALNEKNDSRKCFISRYGKEGGIVVIDYTSFFPRIICYLTNYDLSIDIDIYSYLAKLYYQKSEIDETDIKNSKQLTFKQLFGGIDTQYEHIKYLSTLKKYISEQWDFFNKNNYVLTPIFNRKITDKHIKNPNPTKVFNYILQATEGELAITKLKEVVDYLSNKLTKPELYIYDAVLYDFYKGDGIQTLHDLKEIMGYNNKFPLKVYIGENYHNIQQIS